jgi:3-deoxy-manno-octulosonate cytidylyltransferase (CMP-KDO synthetase)
MESISDILFAGIIPARYASTRFPGKPLAMIGNKPMIQRVHEQSLRSIETVYVATDDHRIFDIVVSYGGKAVMTSVDHQSGTDRCAEAIGKIIEETGKEVDVVVNIQGDEPFIRPEQIDLLKACFSDRDVKIATLVRKVTPGEDLFNPNQPKVILDCHKNAIYFSRSAIPHIRGAEPQDWSRKHLFYKHVGLYAYCTDTLKEITRLSRSALEISESLEQNRWIENGFRVRCALTEMESYSIDTPDDLQRVISSMDHFL